MSEELDNCKKVMNGLLEEIENRILSKRGRSTEEWVRSQDPMDLNPPTIRDKTLMEIFYLIHDYRTLHRTVRKINNEVL
jgi:hypothetical protein